MHGACARQRRRTDPARSRPSKPPSMRTDPFSIVVIDLQMPGMDGETLGRSIQADPRMSAARMVMLTSLGSRGDAKRYAQLGFAGYLAKPVLRHDLQGVLSLTLDRQPADPRPIVTRHAVRETSARLDSRIARILVAEDNYTNQQVALGMLKVMGLNADAVANGAEVLKVLETIPYDLLLMDCQMPIMDGYETTRTIRDLQSRCQKPCYSDHCHDRIRHKGRTAEMPRSRHERLYTKTDYSGCPCRDAGKMAARTDNNHRNEKQTVGERQRWKKLLSKTLSGTETAFCHA